MTISEEYVIKNINDIINEALTEAHSAASTAYGDLGDHGPCGFAWTSLFTFQGKKIKGNTKLGKALKAAGVRQAYDKSFRIWDPAGLPTQNVNIKDEGARAAARVFVKYGIEAYQGSRLD